MHELKRIKTFKFLRSSRQGILSRRTRHGLLPWAAFVPSWALKTMIHSIQRVETTRTLCDSLSIQALITLWTINAEGWLSWRVESLRAEIRLIDFLMRTIISRRAISTTFSSERWELSEFTSNWTRWGWITVVTFRASQTRSLSKVRLIGSSWAFLRC